MIYYVFVLAVNPNSGMRTVPELQVFVKQQLAAWGKKIKDAGIPAE